MIDKQQVLETESEYYASYAEFSKTLRTWFVAFGIGGPVVLLTNENAWKAIVASECSSHIGALFLIGGALQVISAFLNKHAMWHQYICEDARYDTPEDKTWKQQKKLKQPYKLARSYSIQNWTDELFDFYTLMVFTWATVLSFIILSAPSNKIVKCNHDQSKYAWIIGLSLAVLIFLLRLFIFSRINRTHSDNLSEKANSLEPMK